MKRKLKFKLRGPFRILTDDGTDLTPPLAKAQGLLLLLLTSAEGMRGRAWIQDRLWSDRGQEQGAASLRQTLSVIRKSLGDFRELLDSDRRVVALDMERILIDAEDDAEFAEGLDIRDSEFDTWLAQERNRQSLSAGPKAEGARPAAQSGYAHRPLLRDTVALSRNSDGSTIAAWSSQVLADGLFLSLSECSHLDVFRTGGPGGLAPCQMALDVNCAGVGAGRMAVRIALVDGRSGRQLWAGHSLANLRGGPPLEDLDVLRLMNRAVEAIAVDREDVPETPERDRADQLLRSAIDKIFSMQPEEVATADHLLATANELRPSPIYLAWRLQIRTIQRLERHRRDEQTLREEGEALAAHVLEAGGSNSMILALLANANLFLFRNPVASLHFGLRSMEQNPANAMSAWSLSSARLYNDDARGAYADAVRGRRMALHSSRRFFWDLQLAAAAMVLGRREEAIGLLEGVTFDRPGFKPPLRYLCALDATRGREETAVKYVRRLKALEPDFSTVRLFEDPNYPASLVHRTNLIEANRVLQLN